MHLLVVDDCADTRQLIKRLLAGEGFTSLSEADSAESAFARLGLEQPLRRPWPPIDLILLDVALPGIDGVEACRRIKADGRFHNTLIVMVTGNGDDGCLQRSFEAGAADYITKPIRRVELIARLRALRALKAEMDGRRSREAELLRVKAALEQANRTLAQIASRDGLTGVANRRSFDAALDREWARARRWGRPLTLALTDIDFFKAYNDGYGHQAGDAALIAVAQALERVAARSPDLVARYGGEEFALILPETGPDAGLEVAGRLGEAVSALQISHAGSPVAPYLTISVGVATLVLERGDPPELLLGQADRALYAAKAAGRNRVMHFAAVAAGDETPRTTFSRISRS
jgi:diguanylate cyclase (GGDEF)-like protein